MICIVIDFMITNLILKSIDNTCNRSDNNTVSVRKTPLGSGLLWGQVACQADVTVIKDVEIFLPSNHSTNELAGVACIPFVTILPNLSTKGPCANHYDKYG